MDAAEPHDTAVLSRDGTRLPRAVRRLPLRVIDDDLRAVGAAAEQGCRRLVVVGDDADLAAVLTRLLRLERLDLEVGYVTARRTPASRAYRLPVGRRAARRAVAGTAAPAALVRDDTGTVLVGAAEWRPAPGAESLHGEGIVDDEPLFDGAVAGVRIEPLPNAPGVRAGVISAGGRVRRWTPGRAAQLGTPAAQVVRDGVPGKRTVRRSTFYPHVRPWQLVR